MHPITAQIIIIFSESKIKLSYEFLDIKYTNQFMYIPFNICIFCC